MKKLFYLFIGILVFASCNKDADTVTAPEAASKSKFVAELNANDEMLSFASAEEMQETIDKLVSMGEEELVAWYKQAGSSFTSQEILYREAINDLTLLQNFEEADAFKAKYIPYLMFNDDPADEELYDPWLPNEDFPGLSYVANKNGDVRIAGKVVNLNRHKTVKELAVYKVRAEYQKSGMTRATTISDNYLFVEENKRRMWVEGVTSGANYGISVRAQLKNLFGWNKYKADWSFRATTYCVSSGRVTEYLTLQSCFNSVDYTLKKSNIPNNSIFWLLTLNHVSTAPIEIRPGSWSLSPTHNKMVLNMKIWTSGISSPGINNYIGKYDYPYTVFPPIPW